MALVVVLTLSIVTDADEMGLPVGLSRTTPLTVVQPPMKATTGRTISNFLRDDIHLLPWL